MKTKLLFLFMGISIGVFSQIDDFKLDSYLEVLEEHQKFNGSVAIAKNGDIIYQKSVGFSDYENQKKNNSETIFRIGSISKTFTATLVMMAVDEGKIKLQDKISKYFSEVKNADKITVEMLLNHRSGIYNLTALPDYLSWNTHEFSRNELIEKISTFEGQFEPGTAFDYSNSNYILLSVLLEKLYGKPFEEILNEKIIQALQLKRTAFFPKIDSKNNEAYSYYYTGDWAKSSETSVSIPLGAGGISSTPADLIQFGEALFGGQLLSKESLEKMKKLTEGYGYGVFVLPFYDKIGLGHTGGIDNFNSTWAYFEKEKVSFVVLSNGADYDTNNVAIALLSAAYGKDFSIPVFKKSDAEVIPGYTGVFRSGHLGLDITITEQDGQYFAQASGQSAFPLEKINEFEFRFDLAGIVIEFNSDLKSIILKQGGGEFIFVKQ